jgi:aspartate-semialdehyde dehydrogenase
MKKTGLNVAVIGATGAVGKEMLDCLEKRKFPFAELRLFASAASAGKELTCGGKKWKCAPLAKGCFTGIDFAFFDASDEVSKEWVKEAREAGAIVVDSSGVNRMNAEVPLIVPEVNGALLKSHRTPGSLVAGPNCTTSQLVVALKPLHDKYGLKRVIVSTYQAVSGAGAAAVEELLTQSADVLAGREPKAVKLKHPIAFNCIPQIGSFLSGADEGVTSEEQKVIQETRKILGLPNLAVSCTAIRVPTVACHAESVNAEFERKPDAKEARKVLADFPGIEVLDDPATFTYPMNRHGAGRDPVYVGRIRKDPSHEFGLQFWVVADNLRKGAALNAIQIAEAMLA